MPRMPPPFPTAEPLVLRPPDQTVWELTLETITPMFGGSAITRKVDAKHPVRAASVRGHLRFWWRATAGAGFESAEKLFEAEAKIWGSADKQGAVRVEVKTLDAGKETQPIRHQQRGNGQWAFEYGSYPAYALFPFQGKFDRDGTVDAPNRAREDVQFRLTLTCPHEHTKQVQQALRAWVMFGGIGARTRRGCGSLKADGLSGVLNAPQSSPKLLTALPAVYYRGQPQSDAAQAWAKAVQIYSDFRQGDGIARTSSKGRPPVNGKKAPPGRSFWPEPDSLRRATRSHAEKHQPRYPETDGFPRTDLGLPIGFQFKDERAGDPQKLTLQGMKEGTERFASPVITKAIYMDGIYYPAVMILDAPHVWDIPDGVKLITTSGKRNVIARIPVEKLQIVQEREPQNGKPIRQALADFVQQSNFTEVKL